MSVEARLERLERENRVGIGAIGFDRDRDDGYRSTRLPWKRQLVVGFGEDYGTFRGHL